MAGAERTPPTSVSEAVQAAQQGHEEGFRLLYERHWNRGLALLQRHWPSLDADTHEDLLQTAFARVFRKIDQLCFPEAFDYWFFSTLVNRARTWSGRENDRREKLKHHADMTSPPDPDESLRQELRIRVVHDLVDATPDEQTRRMARMSLVEEVPCREIARRLGTTEASVRSRLYRLRKDLRAELLRSTVLSDGLPMPEALLFGAGERGE